MRLGINFLVTLKGERMETYSQNLCLIQNNGVGAGFMAYAKINRDFYSNNVFPLLCNSCMVSWRIIQTFAYKAFLIFTDLLLISLICHKKPTLFIFRNSSEFGWVGWSGFKWF